MKTMADISGELKQKLLRLQKTEITEHHIYRRLALKMEYKNREILERIALDEKRHADSWRRYTG